MKDYFCNLSKPRLFINSKSKICKYIFNMIIFVIRKQLRKNQSREHSKISIENNFRIQSYQNSM